jgi:hypothetical protein
MEVLKIDRMRRLIGGRVQELQRSTEFMVPNSSLFRNPMVILWLIKTLAQAISNNVFSLAIVVHIVPMQQSFSQ